MLGIGQMMLSVNLKKLRKVVFMKNLTVNALIATTWFVSCSYAYAAENTVTVDATTGAWVFQYNDTIDGEYKKRIFIPPTLIEPAIQSSIGWNGKQFVYSYTVRNGKAAKQDIARMFVRSAPINLVTRPRPEISPEDRQDRKKSSDHTQLHMKWLEDQRKDANSRMSDIYEWQALIHYGPGMFSYGWASAYQDISTGVKSGETRGNMRLTGPSLPGVLMMRTEGNTPSEPLPAGMPKAESEFRTKVKALLATIGLATPVLGPAITVPAPYNGAELARRVKAHVQTWQEDDLISALALASINREFDVMINALERGDKAGVRGSTIAIWQQLFTHHHDLSHHKFNDDVRHESPPKRQISVARDGVVTVNGQLVVKEPINRVAARALGINLMYLLTRSEIGR
jgi:hypothetical protein